jgi:hypothetical protein
MSALTNWGPQREGKVRTQKESDRTRGAHFLKTREGGTHQDTKKKGLSERYSLSGPHRGRDKSGHGKKVTG